MNKPQEKIIKLQKEIEKFKEEQHLLRSVVRGYLIEIDKKLNKILNIAAGKTAK